MPPTTIKSEEEEIQKLRRSDEEILLDLLLVMIMGLPPNSDVKQALNDAGVRSIVDIFTLEDDLISQLTYHDGTERVSLKLLDISKLRKIGPFHEALCDRENVYSLTNYMWSNVEPDDWREYCVNPKSFGGSQTTSNYESGSYHTTRYLRQDDQEGPRGLSIVQGSPVLGYMVQGASQ